MRTSSIMHGLNHFCGSAMMIDSIYHSYLCLHQLLCLGVPVVACRLRGRELGWEVIEEEEGFYMLRPVSKTDHMCQDIKVLTKH